MHVRFWGVRGSIASPGPDTAHVGGNTSCVEVRCGPTRIILDAGTGIRALGEAMVREAGPHEATILLSHLHWDHIQGLPFFPPAYLRSTGLDVRGPADSADSLRNALAHQMTSPVFPVGLKELPCQLSTRELWPGEEITVGDVMIRTAKINHPGGGLAYRIEHEGRAMVYATDTEHYACVDPTLEKLASGADLLIYDAQYLPEEYRGEVGFAKVGWGHSTFEAGCELAQVAGVGLLVLFHHDPRRTDDGVEAMEQRARRRFDRSVAAREGMCLEPSGFARAA